MQLRSIQALRAIAALAVMFAHLYGVEARQSGDTPLLSANWVAGVSGVDLFFVISGFIMVWVAGDTPPSLKNATKFLFARGMRIYPLWWLFAGAMALYYYAAYGLPWDADKLANFDVSGPEHLLKSLLLIPQDAYPVMALGWTLIHEMYFYLVFALLLLLPRAYRLPAMLIWGLIIVAAMSAQLTGFYANTLISLVLFPMTLEFLMGAGVAWALKAGWTHWRWPALLFGTIGLVWAAGAINFVEGSETLALERTLIYGPAFAFLVYAIVAFELDRGLGRFIPDTLVRIGDWSYSLYLCHLLVISALGRLFFPVFGRDGYIDNAAYLALSIAASLLVAGLTYRFFERPVLSASRVARRKWFA